MAEEADDDDERPTADEINEREIDEEDVDAEQDDSEEEDEDEVVRRMRQMGTEPELSDWQVDEMWQRLQQATSGSSRTDLLAGVIGLQLLLRPVQAMGIARSWVANVIPFPGALTMAACYNEVIRALVDGTTRGCELALFFHKTGNEGRPLAVSELLLFPGAYNLGLSRHLLINLLGAATLEALEWLVTPYDFKEMLQPPFLYALETGSMGQFEVRNFTGNRLLSMLYNVSYFIHLATVAWVNALVVLQPELFDFEPELYFEMLSLCVNELRRLSAAETTEPELAAELSRLSQIMDDHKRGKPSDLAQALKERTLWWHQQANTIYWLVRVALRRLGSQPQIDPRLDPTWLGRELINEAIGMEQK